MLLTSCFHQLKQASDNATLLLVGLGYDSYMCTWLWNVFRDFWAQWSGQCGAAIVDNGWWSERKWALMLQDVQCNSRIRSWGFETWQTVFSPTREKNVWEYQEHSLRGKNFRATFSHTLPNLLHLCYTLICVSPIHDAAATTISVSR